MTGAGIGATLGNECPHEECHFVDSLSFYRLGIGVRRSVLGFLTALLKDEDAQLGNWEAGYICMAISRCQGWESLGKSARWGPSTPLHHGPQDAAQSLLVPPVTGRWSTSRRACAIVQKSQHPTPTHLCRFYPALVREKGASLS